MQCVTDLRSCGVRSVSLFMLIFFFFIETATTEIYTLSLHDALPIFPGGAVELVDAGAARAGGVGVRRARSPDATETREDRKSTRLNSSHSQISYAVFCLKKKNKKNKHTSRHDKQIRSLVALNSARFM